MKPKTFGLVFRSTDAGALEKVKDFIHAELDESKIVYCFGPTDKKLWLLASANPEQGKENVATSRDSA
jgi:hypothetical protein